MKERLPSVTLAMVMSINGVTATRDGQILSSDEDKIHFQGLKMRFPYILLGSNTFDIIRNHVTFIAPPHRLVFTRNPSRYAAYKNDAVTFTNDSPRTVLRSLAKKGIDRVLLAGGSALNSSFLKAKLISKMIITVEPYISEPGSGLFSSVDGVRLTLDSYKRLNKRGTTVMYYTVENEDNRI